MEKEKEIREYMYLLFEGYKNRKMEDRLYHNHDNVPKIIISSYLNLIKKPSFKDLIHYYKKQYIYCESSVEANMSNEEKNGLSDVYDYIQSFNFDTDYFNIFTTSMLIHNKLYKHCGDGTFGGKLRDSSAVLRDVNIEVADPVEAKKIFNGFISNGDRIFNKLKSNDIFGYIEDCIKLNVELIKLQPFADGNKRTFRSLLNLLFKKINIPPIFIENMESDEYKKALIKAFKAEKEEDYDDIIQFYYYKICDAIMVLDIYRSNVNTKNFKTK